MATRPSECGRAGQSALRLQAHWIADDVAAGRVWLAELAEATHFHTIGSEPEWRRDLVEVARVGRLVFHRSPELKLPPFIATDIGTDGDGASSRAAGARTPTYARLGSVRVTGADDPSSAGAATETAATAAGAMRAGEEKPVSASATTNNGSAVETAERSVESLKPRTTARRVEKAPVRKAQPIESGDATADRTALMKALTPNN